MVLAVAFATHVLYNLEQLVPKIPSFCFLMHLVFWRIQSTTKLIKYIIKNQIWYHNIHMLKTMSYFRAYQAMALRLQGVTYRLIFALAYDVRFLSINMRMLL